MADSPKAKRQKGNETMVDNFLKWCKDVNLSMNSKVTVREAGSCHRFGMIALEKLQEGECIFKIPRNILLQPSTSSISSLLVELDNDAKNHKRHRWLPLLITLLYEYTKPSSKWRPYLDLVPTKHVLNQSIFWAEEELQLLALIDMEEEAKDDIARIERQYNNEVIPFMNENCKYFDPKVHTLELYKRLSGFVMAYSFTDNDPDGGSAQVAMVPMADILNHVTDNNAHLEYGEEYLSMVATKTIEKGDEVFNTYGNLDNAALLCFYGFIEDCPNPYDEVDIPMGAFQEVLGVSDDVWQTMMECVRQEHPDMNDTGVMFDCFGCLCSEDDFYGLFVIIHDEEENDSDEGRQEYIERPDPERTTSQDSLRHAQQFLENNYHEGEEGNHEVTEEEEGNNEDEEEEEDYDGPNPLEERLKHVQPFDELICLKEHWRQTLSRAAAICSRGITEKLEKFQSKSYEGQSARRKAMVEDIVQGHLSIFKQIEQLYQT